MLRTTMMIIGALWSTAFVACFVYGFVQSIRATRAHKRHVAEAEKVAAYLEARGRAVLADLDPLEALWATPAYGDD